MAQVKEILTQDEFASFLSVELDDLRKMRREGTGPKFTKINNRHYYYMWKHIHAWLEGKTHTTNTEARMKERAAL